MDTCVTVLYVWKTVFHNFYSCQENHHEEDLTASALCSRICSRMLLRVALCHRLYVLYIQHRKTNICQDYAMFLQAVQKDSCS